MRIRISWPERRSVGRLARNGVVFGETFVDGLQTITFRFPSGDFFVSVYRKSSYETLVQHRQFFSVVT